MQKALCRMRDHYEEVLGIGPKFTDRETLRLNRQGVEQSAKGIAVDDRSRSRPNFLEI
jgi:hypothetical protein